MDAVERMELEDFMEMYFVGYAIGRNELEMERSMQAYGEHHYEDQLEFFKKELNNAERS